MIEDTTVEVTGWKKSSFSGADGCIEVGDAGNGVVALRDTKDPDGPVTYVTRQEFDEWVRGCAAGDFDELR